MNRIKRSVAVTAVAAAAIVGVGVGVGSAQSSGLTWRMHFVRNANGQVVKVIGRTHVGGQPVKAVVTAHHVDVTVNGEMRLPTGADLTNLSHTINDLQHEIDGQR